MTQKELNLLFSITITIHEHEWFGKRKKPLDRNKVQKWVAEQLAASEIYTIPCGMSWGILTDKEHFDKYWDKQKR